MANKDRVLFYYAPLYDVRTSDKGLAMWRKIVDAMFDKYEAPREMIAADVKMVLDTLRSIEALEE